MQKINVLLGCLLWIGQSAQATSYKFPEVRIEVPFVLGSDEVGAAQRTSIEQAIKKWLADCKTADMPLFIVDGGGVIDWATLDGSTRRTRAVRNLVEQAGGNPLLIYEATQPASVRTDGRASAVQIQYTCIPR